MNSDNPVFAFQALTPDQMLDAVESQGVISDGRFLALNSYENRVYQIGVEENSPIVAKFYRPQRWSDECIREEHLFTQTLSDLEIPVIPPLSADTGESLHRHGPFRFSLYPCRGGRAPELDNGDHLTQLGRFIGRIHAAASDQLYQHRPTLNLDSYVISSKQTLLDMQVVPAHIEEAYFGMVEMLITQIGHCYERAGGIKSIRLHADLHPSNLLWTDNGPHIVDFDDARNGPAIQDLWMLLSGESSYMSARLGELLEGYTQFNHFNPAELHLIEALRTMRMIHHSAWIASRWEDPAFPIAFPWFDSLQYWEGQVLALREQSALMNEEPVQWVR